MSENNKLVRGALSSDDTDYLPDADEATERARINAETARIAWHDLQRFFAQGHAVYVSPDMDLVDVAWEIACDNGSQVEDWMGKQKIGLVTDVQALEWLDADALMWCVVVRPWVLVQPVVARTDG